MSTIIHIDVRELSGLPTDAPIHREAVFSFSPPEIYHRIVPPDYLLTMNELEIRTVDGEATFMLPASTTHGPVRVRENGFRGARIKCLTIPDQFGTVEYGDLVEVAC